MFDTALLPECSQSRGTQFLEKAKHWNIHFNALLQHTEKAINRAKSVYTKIFCCVLTRMIMQDRLSLSEEIRSG
jgi:hypothetical protein